MIFQLPINLEVENKSVQFIIDLDTGQIGFTDSIDNETIEYYYWESPIEFRKALIDKLKPLAADKSLINFKICRKNLEMKKMGDFLKNLIEKE